MPKPFFIEYQFKDNEKMKTRFNGSMKSQEQLSESYFSWTDEEVKKREKRKGIQTKDELISVFRQQLGEIRSNS